MWFFCNSRSDRKCRKLWTGAYQKYRLGFGPTAPDTNFDQRCWAELCPANRDSFCSSQISSCSNYDNGPLIAAHPSGFVHCAPHRTLCLWRRDVVGKSQNLCYGACGLGRAHVGLRGGRMYHVVLMLVGVLARFSPSLLPSLSSALATIGRVPLCQPRDPFLFGRPSWRPKTVA
jgi:hypothetical protein